MSDEGAKEEHQSNIERIKGNYRIPLLLKETRNALREYGN